MATALDNIVSVLQKWDFWRTIEALPGRVEELERRIALLEERLQRAPGEACPKCGELEFRTEKVKPLRGPIGKMGAMERFLKCEKCGHSESKVESPK